MPYPLSLLLVQKPSLWLRSIQQGFIITLPIVILGSIALSLLQIPRLFPMASQEMYVFTIASWVHQASYGTLALLLTLAISYKLNSIYKYEYKYALSPIINTTLSLTNFIAITLIDFNGQITTHLGVDSVAKAIVCSIVTTELIALFYQQKFSKLQFLQNEIHDDIHLSLTACIPAIIVCFTTLFVYDFMIADSHLLSAIIPSLIGEINPQLGLSYLQSTGLIVINQGLWFLGIHPSSLIEINPDLIYSPVMGATYARHFFDTYAHLGGAGSTLGLIICLLLSHKKRHKKMGYYAILPGVFNINELLLFGLPIVFNRHLILPFILAPVITTSIARAMLELNLVTLNPEMSAWNTPAIVSGYLSGGYPAALLQLLLILISALIYWPFLLRYENQLTQEKQKNSQAMIKDLCNPDLNFHKLIKRQTPLADFCRQLQKDMKIQLGRDCFSMHYQAKVDCQQQIIGAEALVRWHHPLIGNIPPCIFISIAETDDFIHELGQWINQRCFKDLKVMKCHGVKDIQIAINVSPIQLTKASFFNDFSASMLLHKVSFKEIEIEITESQKLQLSDDIINGITELSEKGISIAVDDFGMGYTSLKYLKSFQVNTIKLDGSLVKDVLTSHIIKDIIQSLASLTSSMNGKLVAEWVEEEAQYQKLITLGCNQFQGAYFSMPVSLDEFIALVHQGLTYDETEEG